MHKPNTAILYLFRRHLWNICGVPGMTGKIPCVICGVRGRESLCRSNNNNVVALKSATLFESTL